MRSMMGYNEYNTNNINLASSRTDSRSVVSASGTEVLAIQMTPVSATASSRASEQTVWWN